MDQKLRRDAELRATVQRRPHHPHVHYHHTFDDCQSPPVVTATTVTSSMGHVATTTTTPKSYQQQQQQPYYNNDSSSRNHYSSSIYDEMTHQPVVPYQKQEQYTPSVTAYPAAIPQPGRPWTPPPTTTASTPYHHQQQQQNQIDRAEEEDMACTARNEWQQYGSSRTQVLEDLRHGRYYHHNHNHDTAAAATTTTTTGIIMPIPQRWKIGKVTRAEQRTDIAGSPYTTYIIHIWDRSPTTVPVVVPTTTTTTSSSSSSSYTANNNNNKSRFNNLSSIHVIERRFSDFCKLYHSLCGAFSSSTNQQRPTTRRTNEKNSTMLLSYDDWYDQIMTLFPSKHWAGRLGNWTPAKYIAPQQHQTVIHERLQCFDAWFVYVLFAYNIYPTQMTRQQQSPSSSSSSFLSEQQNTMIHDFITNPSPPPPYMIRTATTTTTTTTRTDGTLQYHNPVTFTLSSAIRQATTTIQIMTQQVQKQQHQYNNKNATSTPANLPIDLLHVATGIVFLTVAKIGMIVSGRVGTGAFIAKRPMTATLGTGNESTQLQQQQQQYPWSAPVAVGTIGLGWGAVVGGDVTHYMIVFTTDDAVRDFGRNHTAQLGTEFGISIGPTGIAASQQIQSKSKDFLQYHSTYAYAISSGFFIGVTLEGSIISIRHDVNAKFYGQRNISVADLLQSPGVPAAESLYAALDIAIQQEIPEHAVFKISRYLQRDDDDDNEK